MRIMAIRLMDGVRRASRLRWGLIPHWAKDGKMGYATINARAETVAFKPAYREAFRRRRCLIPADGFYEWQVQPDGKTRQPFFISRADGSPLALAGLWERWCPPQGDPVESCTIIVTTANTLIAPIHERMPVLLEPDAFATWLDPCNDDTRSLTRLLCPCPAERLQAVRVSQRVNNPRHDDAGLIQAVAD